MRNVLVRNLTKKKPHDRINVINQLFSGQCLVIRLKFFSKSDKLLSEPVTRASFWPSSGPQSTLVRSGSDIDGDRTK